MEMKYITELLYDHDCVIIPGFGGFVSSYESASVNHEKNLFTPPFKKVMFNERLKSNDGILANFIAQKENIPYSSAMNLIRRFAEKCMQEMDAERKVRFRGIGLLYRDENGNIQFSQDTTLNYLTDAFGLTAFNSPAIHRVEAHRRFEKKLKDNPHNSLRARRWMKGLKWAAVIVPIFALGTWAFLNRQFIEQKYEQYAVYFAPITGENAGKSITRNELEQQLQQKKNTLQQFEVNTSSLISSPVTSNEASEVPPEESVKETGMKEQPVDNQIAKPAPATKDIYAENQTSYTFNVITGSFLDYKNAQTHMARLKELGFIPEMAGKNSYGYYRVAATGTDKRSEALQRLRLIRQEDYQDAWLLVNH